METRTETAADEDLLAGVVIGNREAMALLFERYGRAVHSIAFRILRNSTEAEDLVQDLFLFLQKKCGIFDPSKCSARSWIIQMAYHRAIDRRRYLSARKFYSHMDVEPSRLVGIQTNEVDYSAEAVFGRNGLARVLEALSDDQRETLRLYFFEGYTLAEISEKMGQPLGNVRHHYYRALDRLRRQMCRTKALQDDGHGK